MRAPRTFALATLVVTIALAVFVAGERTPDVDAAPAHLQPRGDAEATLIANPLPAPTRYGADAQSAPQTLKVGIKPLDPFVNRTGTRYTGFSVELWDEVARRNGWVTNYVWFDTLPPLIDDVITSRLDVGIAGISITREREGRLDFTHPMFNS